MVQYTSCRVITIMETFAAAGRSELGFRDKRTFKKQEKHYHDKIIDVLDRIKATNLGKRLYASLERHQKI
ncbi:MAG: hypothetical protein ACREH4_13660 [Vitreimonas sp.]